MAMAAKETAQELNLTGYAMEVVPPRLTLALYVLQASIKTTLPIPQCESLNEGMAKKQALRNETMETQQTEMDARVIVAL